MKSIRQFLAIAFVIPLFSCDAQTGNKQVDTSNVSSDKIEAYYFHFTARCTTCRTIEAGAKENLETLYPDHVRRGLITFQSVNLEEASGRLLAEKLGVSGQTLLIVRGDKKINLTNEGFMYAVFNPEKFKEIIREKVDDLLSI